MKVFFEEKGETKVYIRITYTAEDEVCKAKRGVFYGFIKEQEIVKKNIIYESTIFESVEEKLMLLNDLFQQILEVAEKPLLILKEEKDYLFIKLALEGDLGSSLSGRYILQNPSLIQLVQKIRTLAKIKVRLAQELDMQMWRDLTF